MGMKFDKEKVLSAINADKAKVGDEGWLADHPNDLRDYVENESLTSQELDDVDLSSGKPFIAGGISYAFFYPRPKRKGRLNSVLLEGVVDTEVKDNRFMLKSDGLVIEVLADPGRIMQLEKGDVIRVVGRLFGTNVAIMAEYVEYKG